MNTSTKSAPTSRCQQDVSVRVRERLEAAGQRYFANDNIHEHLRPGEQEALQREVEGKLKTVLEALVIDVERDLDCRH